MDDLSNNGEILNTIDWNGDNAYAMTVNHFKKIEETIFTSVPSKVNGIKTATSIFQLYNTYGTDVSITGALNQLTFSKATSEYKKLTKMTAISFVVMNTNTWIKLQEKLAGNCQIACNPNDQNVLGGAFAQRLVVPGYGVIEVVVLDDFPEIEDGMIMPIDASNSKVAIYSNILTRELQPCTTAKTTQRTFQTVTGGIMLNPYVSGFIFVPMS
jgi:hypothetical protein